MRSSCEIVETKSRLHLLDEEVGGDVAEGEDPARDLAGRVAHDRLGEREPELAAAAADRDEAVAAAAVLRLELALQQLGGLRPTASVAGTPVIRSAAAFQRTTSPSRSTATIPSAMFARIASLRSFSTATRW